MSEVVNIKGHGAPSRYFEGVVGQIYTDLDTGERYECVEIHKIKTALTTKYTYVWKKKEDLDIDVSDLPLDEYATDVELQTAIDTLRDEVSDVIAPVEGLAGVFAEIIE